MWAGGYHCLDCGAKLIHTDDPAAHGVPDVVWRNQRLDYGARRGMNLRFLGIFAGVLIALYGAREAVPYLPATSGWLRLAGSLLVGFLVWWTIHHAAGRGVRLWVLRKGQLQKRKLGKALAAQTATTRRS